MNNINSDTILEQRLADIERTIIGFKTAQPIAESSWVGYSYTYIDSNVPSNLNDGVRIYTVEFLPENEMDTVNRTTFIDGYLNTYSSPASWVSNYTEVYADISNPNKFVGIVQKDFDFAKTVTILLRSTQPGTIRVSYVDAANPWG